MDDDGLKANVNGFNSKNVSKPVPWDGQNEVSSLLGHILCQYLDELSHAPTVLLSLVNQLTSLISSLPVDNLCSSEMPGWEFCHHEASVPCLQGLLKAVPLPQLNSN